jgi:2-polyprenyl-6-methoxyphenol hydroxylase-like FAD-dependent oxidoreductase
MSTDYDVITVGGGLGGAALAKVLAQNGMRVLVVERELQFKDRIRGEWIAPWGVAEAQRLGLYDALLKRCAREAPFFDTVGMGPRRDLRATTPQGLPALALYHPAMQEAVLNLARDAGAEVWRGASVSDLRPGATPVVTIERDGQVREFSARLVVCADGRSSMGRTWGGFTTVRGTPKLLGAGVLFDHLSIDQDTSVSMLNPFIGRGAYLFPQGGGRVRAYLMYETELPRLQGDGDTGRFIEECVRTGLPPETYAGARPVGPLASFDMTESWVNHSYRAGVALLGDAAGSSDPTWGQGLSQTLRDVRILSDNLLAGDDWDSAAHDYANARDAYFKTLITVTDWIFDLFFPRGPEADQRRERALPLLLQEPDRFPDHIISGPELPCDDAVRRYLFGEA